MLKIDLKIAIRNMARHKYYSILNMIFLAVGMAFFIMLISCVRDELTFDRFHKNSDFIYLISSKIANIEGIGTPPSLSGILESESQSVRRAVRVWKNAQMVKQGDIAFKENITYTDSSFFEVFTFPFSSVRYLKPLTHRNEVIISSDMAKKYFDEYNPIGQKISIAFGPEDRDFIVSGVLESIPSNSSIKPDFLISFKNIPDMLSTSGDPKQIGAHFINLTFIVVKDKSGPVCLQAQLPFLVAKYFRNELSKYRLKPSSIEFQLHKFTEYHLGTIPPAQSLDPQGHVEYSFFLSGIAFVILIMVCFNYMNFSMGHFYSRFKEASTRKIYGAQRKHFIKQFIIEAVALILVTILGGIMMVEIFLPEFNRLTGKNLYLSSIYDWHSLIALIGAVILIGTVSGVYPSLLVARLKPAEIFREMPHPQIKSKTRGARTLTVFQFGLSIALIASAVFMKHQLNFIVVKEPGYNAENVIVISTLAFDNKEKSHRILAHFKDFYTAHHDFSDIVSITGTSGWFGMPMGRSSSSFFGFQGKDVVISIKKVDADFLKTMEIPLIAGKDFSQCSQEIVSPVLVNEAFVKEFNIHDPVGKTFRDIFRVKKGSKNPRIIGVVKNFQFSSVHRAISPLVLTLDPETPVGYILVRVNPENLERAILYLQDKWAEIQSETPAKPFIHLLLEELNSRSYSLEKDWSRVIGHSAGFAIFISCLGLFGLTSLSILKLNKEIGIRKVLGARIHSILFLLIREIAPLILLANIIAWPTAYFIMKYWMKNFSSPMEITVIPFVLAGLISLCIGVITVLCLTFRTAITRPAEMLRYD